MSQDQEQKYGGIWTKKGLEKLAAFAAGGNPINITESAFGDGNGTVPTPEAENTSLVHEVWRGRVASVTQKEGENSQSVMVEVVIPYNVGGFFIREWGLYDADGDLVVYGNHAEFYKALLIEGTGAELRELIELPVSSKGQVQITVNYESLASVDYVNTVLEKEIKEHNESEEAHMQAFGQHNKDEEAHEKLFEGLKNSINNINSNIEQNLSTHLNDSNAHKKLFDALYDAIDDIPLEDYVTKNTKQTISGQKTFLNELFINNSVFDGIPENSDKAYNVRILLTRKDGDYFGFLQGRIKPDGKLVSLQLAIRKPGDDNTINLLEFGFRGDNREAFTNVMTPPDTSNDTNIATTYWTKKLFGTLKNTISLKSTRGSDGVWTITGLEINKPLFITANIKSIHATAYDVYAIDGTDDNGTNSSDQKASFKLGKGASELFMVIPKATTITLNLSGGGTNYTYLRAYQ